MAGWQNSDKKTPDEAVYFASKNGEQVKGYLWYPEGYDAAKIYNAVVMAHGCAGAHYKDEPEKWTARYIAGKYKVWGKLLNEKDIVVMLVDSFTTRDVNGDVGGGVCSSNDALDRPAKIDPISVRPADIAYGIQHLRSNSAWTIDKVGVLGFSNGATSALVLANHSDLAQRSDTLVNQGRTWFNVPFSMEYRANLVVSMYPGCGLNGYTQESQGLFSSQFSTYADTYLYAASNDTSLPANTKEKCQKLRQLDADGLFESTNMKTVVVNDTNHQFDYKEIDEAPVKSAVKRILALFESM